MSPCRGGDPGLCLWRGRPSDPEVHAAALGARRHAGPQLLHARATRPALPGATLRPSPPTLGLFGGFWNLLHPATAGGGEEFGSTRATRGSELGRQAWALTPGCLTLRAVAQRAGWSRAPAVSAAPPRFLSSSDTSRPRDGKTLHSDTVARHPAHSRPSTSSCRCRCCYGQQRCFQSVGSPSLRAPPGPSWPPLKCLAGGDKAGPGRRGGLG